MFEKFDNIFFKNRNFKKCFNMSNFKYVYHENMSRFWKLFDMSKQKKSKNQQQKIKKYKKFQKVLQIKKQNQNIAYHFFPKNPQKKIKEKCCRSYPPKNQKSKNRKCSKNLMTLFLKEFSKSKFQKVFQHVESIFSFFQKVLQHVE